MSELNSVPLYPISLAAADYPTNLVLNKTPEGRFQIARVVKPGGPNEGEFEVLHECADEASAREYARSVVRKEFPGLVQGEP
jgi:hypothetical protein